MFKAFDLSEVSKSWFFLWSLLLHIICYCCIVESHFSNIQSYLLIQACQVMFTQHRT